VIVLFGLTDRPRQALWLTPEEKEALESQLELEKAQRAGKRRMTFAEAFRNPKVLLLTLAYCCSTAANYGMEFFLPSILERWYGFKLNTITWLVILPPCLALAAQLFVGWNSDRTKERRLHAVTCISIGLLALALTPLTKGHLVLTIACFMLTYAGIKGYQPAFWALPSLFLTSTAAATSIGLINSVGNLGGSAGPTAVGMLEKMTGSFAWGIYFLVACLIVNAIIILSLGLGRKESEKPAQ
jgi:MFS transporter, ACS family, tartrate transporter